MTTQARTHCERTNPEIVKQLRRMGYHGPVSLNRADLIALLDAQEKMGRACAECVVRDGKKRPHTCDIKKVEHLLWF